MHKSKYNLSKTVVAKLKELQKLGLEIHHLNFPFNLHRLHDERDDDNKFKSRRTGEGRKLGIFLKQCKQDPHFLRAALAGQLDRFSPTSHNLSSSSDEDSFNASQDAADVHESPNQSLSNTSVSPDTVVRRRHRGISPSPSRSSLNSSETANDVSNTSDTSSADVTIVATTLENTAVPTTLLTAISAVSSTYVTVSAATQSTSVSTATTVSPIVATSSTGPVISAPLVISALPGVSSSVNIQSVLPLDYNDAGAVANYINDLQRRLSLSNYELEKERKERARWMNATMELQKKVADLGNQLRSTQDSLLNTKSPSEEEIIRKLSSKINDIVEAAVARHLPGAASSASKPATSSNKQTDNRRDQSVHHRKPPDPHNQQEQRPPDNPSLQKRAVTYSSVVTDGFSSSTAPEPTSQPESSEQAPFKTKRRRPRRSKKQPQDKSSLPPRSSPSDSMNSVLVVPTADIPADKVLRSAQIDSSKLDVAATVSFPSGAMLVRCRNGVAADYLRKVAESTANIAVKNRRSSAPVVRIHDCPIEATEEVVIDGLFDKFGILPTSVLFLEYKDPNRKKDFKIALVTVTYELYKAIRQDPSARIYWRNCRIDAGILLIRCRRCQLLGHPEAHCNVDPIPAPVAGECLDCTHHNSRILAAKLPKYRLKPVTHATNSNACTIKDSLQQKKLAQYALSAVGGAATNQNNAE